MADRWEALMGHSAAHSRLPSAYQELAWIETDGTRPVTEAEIDLDYVPHSAPKAFFRLLLPNTGSLGCFVTVSKAEPKWILYFATGNLYYSWGSGSGRLLQHPTGVWMDVEAGRSLQINGLTVVTSQQSDWSGNTASVKLLSSDNAAASVNCRLGPFTLYDGDEPVRELIPCCRCADGRCGFYDLVSGRFFTNAGAPETLIKGEEQ